MCCVHVSFYLHERGSLEHFFARFSTIGQKCSRDVSSAEYPLAFVWDKIFIRVFDTNRKQSFGAMPAGILFFPAMFAA